MVFKKEIITSPKTTGAIGKMSSSASKDIISQIDRNTIQHVVEFGPGRGNVTQEILNHLGPDGRLTCFEINEKDFKSYLDILDDKRLIIHYISCEDINQYYNDESIDLIISTIPLSLIDNDVLGRIFQRSYKSLRSGGIFINGNYSTYGKKFMSPFFGEIQSRRHFKNLPPVCILTGIKK